MPRAACGANFTSTTITPPAELLVAARAPALPTIVNAQQSTAVRLDAASAVQRLLAASGPQLFDRLHMTEHMALLRCLVRQAHAYRLDAGRDLHREPAGVLDLIPPAERP